MAIHSIALVAKVVAKVFPVYCLHVHSHISDKISAHICTYLFEMLTLEANQSEQGRLIGKGQELNDLFHTEAELRSCIQSQYV